MELFNQKKLIEMQEGLKRYLKTFQSTYSTLINPSILDLIAHHKVLNLDFMIEELSQQSLDLNLKLELLTDLLDSSKTVLEGVKNEIVTTIFNGYELNSKQLSTVFTSYDYLTTEEKEVVQKWINTDYRMDICEMDTPSACDNHFVGGFHESGSEVWFYSSLL